MFVLPQDQRNQELFENYKKASSDASFSLLGFILAGLVFCWLLNEAHESWLSYEIKQQEGYKDAAIFCIWMLCNVGVLVIAAVAAFFKNLRLMTKSSIM